MTLDLEAPPVAPEEPPGPESGVIEEARRRRRARRRAIALAVPIAALAGGIAAAILSGGPASHTQRGGGRGKALATLARLEPRPLRSARISPGLTGGSYGWSVMTGGGGSCCTVPVQGAPLQGETSVDSGRGYETATFLAGAELAAIALDGRRMPTRFVPLPYGLRLAQVTIEHPAHGLSLWPDGSGKGLTALNRARQALPRPTLPSGPAVASRWWQRPTAPSRGPCRLSARGLPALSARWGHVASGLLPYGQPIAGRAFFSCIDTEYFLHNWPLDAALLLDAQDPGSAPAGLPEMTPVRGAPGFVSTPGTWQGAITAERVPNAWLVVAGGSGQAQRLEVLRHLTATIALPGKRGAHG